jgi:hypothetical protein
LQSGSISSAKKRLSLTDQVKFTKNFESKQSKKAYFKSGWLNRSASHEQTDTLQEADAGTNPNLNRPTNFSEQAKLLH